MVIYKAVMWKLIIFMASDHAQENLLDKVYFPLAVAVYNAVAIYLRNHRYSCTCIGLQSLAS